MKKVTFRAVTIKNFGQFAENSVLSAVCDSSKKEFIDENTFANKEERINKVTYIYGANGAGKSSLCKAILDIQKRLALSPILAANNSQIMEMKPLKSDLESLKGTYFKYSKEFEQMPTELGIELSIDEVIYSYSFGVLDGKIVKETLTKKNKRTETIMKRTSPNNESIVLKSELSSFKNNLSVVKEDVLCLSMAALLNNPFAIKIMDAIMSINVLNTSNPSRVQNLTEDFYTEENSDRYMKILKIAEPTMNDLKVAFKEEKVEQQHIDANDFENKVVIRNVSVDVDSIHNVYEDGKVVNTLTLPFLQIESTGTIKLFNILPAIFDALDRGTPIIIDEIENGLHPNLTKLIVDLFNNKESNPNNTQLICTSHNINLLEGNTRRDQVWIVVKDDFGKSNLMRVSDVPGIRASENLAQKYLKGAFGGNTSFCGINGTICSKGCM